MGFNPIVHNQNQGVIPSGNSKVAIIIFVRSIYLADAHQVIDCFSSAPSMTGVGPTQDSCHAVMAACKLAIPVVSTGSI